MEDPQGCIPVRSPQPLRDTPWWGVGVRVFFAMYPCEVSGLYGGMSRTSGSAEPEGPRRKMARKRSASNEEKEDGKEVANQQ